MHGGKRAGSGRKPIKIDLVELEKLCSLQCTDEEVADFFNVAVKTIERRRQDVAATAHANASGEPKQSPGVSCNSAWVWLRIQPSGMLRT